MAKRLVIMNILFFFIITTAGAKEIDILKIARNTYSPGSFELYVVPKKYNKIVGEVEASLFHQLKSYIPVNGQYVLKDHLGSDHGLPYDYDSHVPIIIYGEKYIGNGQSNRKVSLIDIVPTMSQLLKLPTPFYSTGNVLKEALLNHKGEIPKVILMFVIDQGGWFCLNSHIGGYPFLTKVMGEGFVFKEAYLNYGQSATGVSHAVLGTGMLPKYNGIFDNAPFLPSIYKELAIYSGTNGVDVMQLKQPTLVDYWDRSKKNEPQILSYSLKEYAAIGMAGHGAYFNGGDKDTVLWYDSNAKKFATDERIFSFPEEAKGITFENYKEFNSTDSYWRDQKCVYKNNQPSSGCLIGSPAFTKMEGDMLERVIGGNHQFGTDNITDLIFISFGGTDYCGHLLGAESAECGRTLLQVDKQIERLHGLLNKLIGGDMVMFVTADHGVSPLTELSGGKILIKEKLINDINQKFDHIENNFPIINKISSAVMHVNLTELKANGFAIEDVKSYLLNYQLDGKPFFEKVITFKELDETARQREYGVRKILING